MIDKVRFARNDSDAQAIGAHLRLCDADFVPPLSTRVVIDRYAEKLADKAERFEAWVEGNLVGLVASYCDRPESGAAFVSSVSLLPARRGSGLGGKLMRDCCAYAAAAGFKRVELRVDTGNGPARLFYGRLGFRILGAEGDDIILHRPTAMFEPGTGEA